MRILVLVRCARRPWTVDEVYHAMGAEPAIEDLDKEALPKWDLILSVSAGPIFLLLGMKTCSVERPILCISYITLYMNIRRL